MTDHQVLIFGSFTEEEVRSLQHEPRKNDVQLTFGSLDSETLRSVGIFECKLAEPHLTKNCKLPSNRQNVCKVPTNSGNIFQLPVALEDKNGCSGSSPSYTAREQKPIHIEQAISISSDQTHESQSNGDHKVETKESIPNAPNGKHVASRNFMPRGLVNLGNLCFLNATLQALLSCSPFFELLRELRNCSIPQTGYPTLRAFDDFIVAFDLPSESICKLNIKSVIETGEPFRPVMFDSILKSFTPDIPNNLSGRPRQEDAQEFLSFVMHQLHDELLKLDGQISNGNGKTTSLVSSTDDEDDDWETVGPKKKTAITRTQSFVPSKLSAIFGGQLRSVVKARGSKASATIQPFLLLHLNICPDLVFTIEDALQLFSAPETLEGYRISAGGKSQAEVVTASKYVKILELPEILVLHLMRFSYGTQGSTKLHKAVHFPLELLVDRELLASPSSEGRMYELVATITHHGRDPWKGHYTADARHPNGKWLRYDDSSVTPIPESKVLHDEAYILFYRQL